MGYDAIAAPPSAWFYASLTSVELGHGLTLGALPCIFAGACLPAGGPLDAVLHGVAITAATASMADAPQVLLDGTPVPAGLSLAGAATIGGLLDMACTINLDAKTGAASLAAAAAAPGVALAFAGGFSALPTTAVMTPGERIKVLLQIQGQNAIHARRLGLPHVVVHAIGED
jgi:hypothetical protein